MTNRYSYKYKDTSQSNNRSSIWSVPVVILLSLLLFTNGKADYITEPSQSQGTMSSARSGNEELVLQYLEAIQDNFSSETLLIPAMEDNSGQTFNNAVTAMAFILTGEKERAERILDFYAQRTDSFNQTLNYQNFFYSNQARGFFQNVDLSNDYYPFICDRWMGDNAWLLIAYKFYESEFGFGSKPLYSQVTSHLKNLLLDFYIDDPTGHGGFIRHGWRWGPRNSPNPVNDYKLHETDSLGNPIGHEEGNIDAYAALKLCGEDQKAEKVKEWIDYRMNVLSGNEGLPLDLFSWRSLAFCNRGLYYKLLVNVPENDPGFKKQVIFKGRQVTGFFSRDDINVNNIWLDGLGHMVCAFYSSGFPERGDYYNTQLDSLLINRVIGTVNCLAVPYTANTQGGYDWVDINKGFSSSCAWYIFAKHGFNPFTFDRNLPAGLQEGNSGKSDFKLLQNFPNPFNLSTTISFSVSKPLKVKIIIYDVLGNQIRKLYDGRTFTGTNEVTWNGTNNLAEIVSSGVYIYRISSGGEALNGKMILNK